MIPGLITVGSRRMVDRLGRRRARAVGFIWAPLLAVMASAANAADPADIEALIREGVALRRAGSDVRALPLFQKAFELAHTPRTAAQLGLVEFSLGYSLDAERHLSQGLAVPTDSWIAKNRKVLDDTLAGVKATIGEVVITGSPEGADVIVNGRPAGRLPLAGPVRVAQGPALVEVKATGYTAASKPVEIIGAKSVPLAIQLQPAPPGLGAGVGGAAIGQSPNDSPKESPRDESRQGTDKTDASPTTADDRHVILRPVAWVAGGVAVAALETGLILRSTVQTRLDAFNGSCRLDPDTNQPVRNPAGPMNPNANCGSLYDRWHSLKNWPAVGYVSAGALAITSGLLFWMSRPQKSSVTQDPSAASGTCQRE